MQIDDDVGLDRPHELHNAGQLVRRVAPGRPEWKVSIPVQHPFKSGMRRSRAANAGGFAAGDDQFTEITDHVAIRVQLQCPQARCRAYRR